jgi:hypothetical protein
MEMSDHFDTYPVYLWIKDLAVPTGWELGGPHRQSVLVGRRKITSLAGNPLQASSPAFSEVSHY